MSYYEDDFKVMFNFKLDINNQSFYASSVFSKKDPLTHDLVFSKIKQLEMLLQDNIRENLK